MQEYWEDRYQKEKDEYFDWYQRYADFKEIIKPHLQPTDFILNVGAGNSRKFYGSKVQ